MSFKSLSNLLLLSFLYVIYLLKHPDYLINRVFQSWSCWSVCKLVDILMNLTLPSSLHSCLVMEGLQLQELCESFLPLSSMTDRKISSPAPRYWQLGPHLVVWVTSGGLELIHLLPVSTSFFSFLLMTGAFWLPRSGKVETEAPRVSLHLGVQGTHCWIIPSSSFGGIK